MKRKLLLAALCVVSALGFKANAQSWAGNAPAEGTFFLYNVGAEKFLNNGDPKESWGTNAYLQAGFGMDIQLEQNNGAYNLNTNVSNGGNSNYLGTETWCDGSATPWTFTAVEGEANTYTIKNGEKYLVANDALNDVVYDALTNTNDKKSWWKLVSLEDFKAAMQAKAYSATDPMDVSVFIKGRSFARNDGRNSSWITSHNGGNWDWIGASDNKYYGNESWNNTFDVHQAIEGLPEGTYQLSCSGFGTNGTTYIYATTGGVTTQKAIQTDNTTSYGTNKAAKWKAIHEDNAFAGQNSGTFVVASGNLTVGIKRETNQSYDWAIWDEFRLYYYGLDLSSLVDAYNDAVTAANNIDQSAPMQSSILADLQSAIETYGTGVDVTSKDELLAATSALATATGNASTSITAYANAKAYLDKMGAVLANTNVYTQESYNAKYGTWLAAYNEKTLETETAASLNANTAYSNGWHADNNIDDVLLSTWTIGGEQCANYDKGLYINTWSTEGNTDGSEFFTPFFEYWTGDANSLNANTLVSTVTNLIPNGTYSFTIRARVRQTNDKTKIANGITMQVGEGTAVDISAGAQFNAGSFYIGNFSAVGQADANGNLTTTITVAENSNISWLSFYNCKVTEGEDLSAYIADYEFALGNVNTALTEDVAYAAMQGNLQAAAATYASVDETDKAALIAAKEALEGVLAAYNEVVAPLKGNNLTGWTKTGNNANFEVNTWSGEGNSDGSNMMTPFTQNWQDRNNGGLGDATMSYTIEGLTPGYYKVTCLIRSLNEKGGATPAGSFIFANDNIERAYGDNASACTNGVYGNPVVYGLVGSDGKLTIGVKIIQANVNWVSWKNFVYEYVGTELTQPIATNQTEEARVFENNTTGAAADDQTEAVNSLATLSDANYTAAGKAIEAAYKASIVNMTVKGDKWGTFIAPFDVEIPAGIKAYTVSGVNESGYMVKKEVTTIPANAPVVLENTTSGNVEVNFADESTAEADSYTVGALTGVYTASVIPVSDDTNNYYVLQTQNDVQAFYIVNDPTAAFTATPNRCYLTVEKTNAAAPRAIFIDEEGDATGIKGVDGQIAKGKVKGIYSANGTELNQLQKGLNIVKMADGKVKKVYVK